MQAPSASRCFHPPESSPASCSSRPFKPRRSIMSRAAPPRVAQAVEPRDELQVLAHRKVLIQAEALRHVADLALEPVGVAADVVAEAAPLAAVGRQQAAEHADGGGLAGTVGAEEAVDRCRASPASRGHARPRGRRTISKGHGHRSRCRARSGPRSSPLRHRRLGVEIDADRLADAQRIRPARPRLDQINELVALIEAVDHGRGVFGLTSR